MCGRFAQIEPVDVIAERLQVEKVQVKNTAPRYNICPGEDIVALVQDPTYALVEHRWGLIPHWVKNVSDARPLINARSETVAQKPSFKKAFMQQRCILPASGFFEWKKDGNKKIPYYITMNDVFGFAGIYDTVNINGTILTTCAILTTQANEQMNAIHNRMPVIITLPDFMTWIDKKTTEDKLFRLMAPFQSNLIIYPVSPKVNSPTYNQPDCIKPY
ncbi:MAG: SOS response-associated peptidase [Spirochaetes bacterium]|nr:SOS response-associated peptidase [Spirochaetota bacterium]